MRLDARFSISIFLHGFWSLILEYRHLNAVHRKQSYGNTLGGTSNLLLSSRRQELIKDLRSFQLIAAEWPDASAQENLLLNLLMMNLHVSMDDLQLFSGKEGEQPARRIYPILQQWAGSAEARSAVCYAGQVLRYAKLFPPDHLKDFYAVAVEQAALALWTYSVVMRANRQLPSATRYGFEEAVYLDDPESMSTERFIAFGQGRPMIRGVAGRGVLVDSSILDPRACMDVVQEILASNFPRSQEGLPPIVENLCDMIQKLGNAAWAVGLG